MRASRFVMSGPEPTGVRVRLSRRQCGNSAVPVVPNVEASDPTRSRRAPVPYYKGEGCIARLVNGWW